MTIDLKDHFFKALKSQPNFSEAHLQLALLYQKEADTENTLKHFELAISTDLEEINKLEKKGDELLKNYQFQNAKEQYIKSQKKKVHCAEVYYQQSIYYNKLEENKSAKSCLVNCIKMNPSQSEPHRDLGILFAKLQQLDDARLNLEKALDFDYSDPIAHFYLGKVMTSMNDFDDAELHYMSALDIKPKFSECILEIALLKLTNKLEQDARKYYQEAKEIDPSIKHPELEKIMG